jgi:hypothetical protein
VSTSPWLGHHGFSPHHLHHVLYSAYHPHVHALILFYSAIADELERRRLPRFTPPESPLPMAALPAPSSLPDSSRVSSGEHAGRVGILN